MLGRPLSWAAAAATATAIFAAALPSLLAHNVSPSPTFLNQALAFALWAGFVIACVPATPRRGPWPVWAALAVLVLAAAWAWGPGSLPGSLALSAMATLLAAAVVLAGGAGARARCNAQDLFAAFCWGWVAAGVANVLVALVQVFLPGQTDGIWLAASGYPGRAVGNLRQPNHLSSLLLWHCVAVVALLELRRLGRKTAGVLLALGVFAVVLSASRTGLVSVLMLALWGLLDKRLSRPARALLLAAPLVYLLSWLAMAQWAMLTQHAFGGSERLAESDISSSRFAIWRDTLTLIAQQPWFGVGFGEFNFAWTLTPLPQRPVAFFDHTHNLPLQLAVELGLPLALLVMALLTWGLWRGVQQAWATPAELGVAQRSAMLMVLMIGLHSLVEYPLWYSYFLLPTAWAWGFALYRPARAAAAVTVLGAVPVPVHASAEPVSLPPALPPPLPHSSLAVQLAALVLVLGACLSVLDFLRVTQIFTPGEGAGPLEQRIASGQRSVFFAHHADYAAVTANMVSGDPVHAFDRVTHYLLDSRLMLTWAQALAERGELDPARHLAARLREFKKVDASEFFAPCPAAGDVVAAPVVQPMVRPVVRPALRPAALPAEPAAPPAAAAPASAASAPAASLFQCQRPSHPLDWRAFAVIGF